VLAGVLVVLRNPETGAVQHSTTGDAGAYQFGALVPASTLTLEASRDGFRPGRQMIDGVTAGERRLVDLRLQVAGVTEAIEVTADTSLGRNSARTSGFAQIDLGLLRRFAIGGASIEARAEIFNVFSRTNFSGFFNYGRAACVRTNRARWLFSRRRPARRASSNSRRGCVSDDARGQPSRRLSPDAARASAHRIDIVSSRQRSSTDSCDSTWVRVLKTKETTYCFM